MEAVEVLLESSSVGGIRCWTVQTVTSRGRRWLPSGSLQQHITFISLHHQRVSDWEWLRPCTPKVAQQVRQDPSKLNHLLQNLTDSDVHRAFSPKYTYNYDQLCMYIYIYWMPREKMYIYIYIYVHILHLLSLYYHHTPTSCPFGLVARYPFTKERFEFFASLGPEADSTWPMGWSWSYGLSHMATLKGLSFDCFHMFRSLESFLEWLQKKTRWPVSSLSLCSRGADIASWLKRFSFAMDSCAKRGKLQDHSLRSCFDLQNWRHSTRGSWMMSV